ncbi:hypothetical protein D3C77_463390 [compost metagenome]
MEEHERFSGTIKYKISFVLEDRTEDIMIDLGKVYEVAEVTLNGVHLGVKITPPYIFATGDLLRTGENELIVEVTNNLGKQEQDYLSQYMIQEPSGLLGPVRLLK